MSKSTLLNQMSHPSMQQDQSQRPPFPSDEDNSIQEMLNELNNGMQQDVYSASQQIPQLMSQQIPQQMSQHISQQIPQPMQLQMHQVTSQPLQMSNAPLNETVFSETPAKQLPNVFTILSSNKVVLKATMLFVLISILPIETWVSKYISLTNILYSNILIKAIVFGLCLFILENLPY